MLREWIRDRANALMQFATDSMTRRTIDHRDGQQSTKLSDQTINAVATHDDVLPRRCNPIV
jgi:hypothetical protein